MGEKSLAPAGIQTPDRPDTSLVTTWNKLWLLPFLWAGYLRRYSDWLRAGRSGYRIPVEARFFSPVQTGPGAHPFSCTMGTGSFPGVKSGYQGKEEKEDVQEKRGWKVYEQP